MPGKTAKMYRTDDARPFQIKERERQMRVSEHPILGALPEAEVVTIYFDGQPIPARAGEPIAAALMNAGIGASARWPIGTSRAVFSARLTGAPTA